MKLIDKNQILYMIDNIDRVVALKNEIDDIPIIEAIPIDWIMEYPDKLKEGIKTIDGLDLAQYIKMHQDLIFYKTQLRIMVERWKEENETDR